MDYIIINITHPNDVDKHFEPIYKREGTPIQFIKNTIKSFFSLLNIAIKDDIETNCLMIV